MVPVVPVVQLGQDYPVGNFDLAVQLVPLGLLVHLLQLAPVSLLVQLGQLPPVGHSHLSVQLAQSYLSVPVVRGEQPVLVGLAVQLDLLLRLGQ